MKLAYHGFQQLSREERDQCYNLSVVRDDFEEPNYGMIDTLFSLAEAYLFMQLVELAVSTGLGIGVWSPDSIGKIIKWSMVTALACTLHTGFGRPTNASLLRIRRLGVRILLQNQHISKLCATSPALLSCPSVTKLCV